MTVKELKEFLNDYNEEIEVVVKQNGTLFEIRDADMLSPYFEISTGEPKEAQ